MSFYRERGKRAADVTVATVLLVAVAPLLVALFGLVRWRLGSPALFRQTRAGRHGKRFTLVKLRTMTDARSPDGTPRPDAERMTRFGAWLRATSLDELPELWNVVRGDMSLVGPRPLLVEYLPRYSSEQARRHEVRPGLTGLAQVEGRNAIGWSERLAKDVRYVDEYGAWVDAWILLKTLVCVLVPTGVHAEGHATMPPFQGAHDADEPVQRRAA